MAIVNYTRTGEAVPDYLAERKAANVHTSHERNEIFKTSSGIMIRAFQMLVANGSIDPVDIAFQYEGQPVKHDQYGRFIDPPTSFIDVLTRMGERFQSDVKKRLWGEMSEENRVKFRELYAEWFENNVFRIFTPPVPPSEEEPKGVAPTQFIYVPDCKDLKRLDKPEIHKKVTMVAWAEVDGQPVAITDAGPITVDGLQDSAFDMDGDKMVPRKWNEAAAWAHLKIDPILTGGTPSWDLGSTST